jgi:hypothetical protein
MAPADQLAVLAAAAGFAPETVRYKGNLRHPDHPLLDFLAVRALLAREGERAPRSMRPGSPVAPDLRVFANHDALPRAFIATAATLVPPGRTVAAVAALIDPRRVVLDRVDTGGWAPSPRAWEPGAVRTLRWSAGEVELGVPADGEKLLATSLPSPAGWRASTGGGSAVTTVRVNHAFLGVRLPHGVERVELTYSPPGFGAGATISALALGLVAWLGLVTRSGLVTRYGRFTRSGSWPARGRRPAGEHQDA